MKELELGITAACLVGAVLVVVALVRNTPVGDRTTSALLAVEVALVVHAVAGIARLARDGDGVSGVTYVGYLIAILLVLPAGWLWAASERNRGGTGVLLVAVLLVPFLLLRTSQVWSAGG
jgi:hypothetical protein